MKKSCVIVVDMQRDFVLPQGALYVQGSEKIVTPTNLFLSHAKNKSFIAASRDYHPADHMSFKNNGGEWNAHCSMGTPGAESVICETYTDMILSKGKNKDVEEYSCVNPLGMNIFFKMFQNIFVCGVARDFCVKNTLLDLADIDSLPFSNIYLIDDLTRSVFPDKEQEVTNELIKAGINIINSKKALEIINK